LLTVGFLLFVLIAAGTAGYTLLEGWPWRDSLFMTVITLSTVGYNEVSPLSDSGQIFSMMLILLGVGSAAYTFSTFADYIVAGELRGDLRRQRMRREIERMKDHFIVCGFGRVGRQVVESLHVDGFDVVVVENDPLVIEELANQDIKVIFGSATEDDSLVEAGIERASGLCSCLPTDSNNVFVVLSARTLNPDLTIIARSNLAESTRKLRIAGADQIINPYLIAGRRMAAQLVHPTLVEFLDVVMQRGDLELRIEEITIGDGSDLDGKTLAECNVRGETGVNVLAVRRAKGKLHTNFGEDFFLSADDALICLGTPEQLAQLAERAADQPKWATIARRLDPRRTLD